MSCRVVIAGAGPAGSAAAIIAAEGGAEVTLLDAAKFPRDRPGEALHPGVRALFERLGVRETVEAATPVRNSGVWVQRDGSSNFKPFAPPGETWLGYQVWRADLDSILVERARSLGVRVLQECRALSLLRDGDLVTGLRTSAGDFHADWVLDGTGSMRWLSRQLGIKLRRESPPLLAQYGYVRGECPERNAAPSFAWHGQSWIWTARVRPGVYQWTRLLRAGEHFERNWIPDELANLTPLTWGRAADVTWMTATRFSEPGYFLLGDAAAVLDPASAHGVLRAIMSGMQAAHLITSGNRKSVQPQVLSKIYSDWMTAWLRHDIANLRVFYGENS